MILVTGASGMLGQDVCDIFESKGHQVKRLLGRKDLDLTNFELVKKCVLDYHPDLIVHTVGLKDVDHAEKDPKLAYELNVLTTKNIALASSEVNAKLIYTSTEAVYDGEKGDYYHEDDPTNPINIYGKTKLEGEVEVKKYCHKYFIVRLGLLLGYKGHKENSMVYNLLGNLKQGNKVNASVDQICSPSYTKDIAEALEIMGNTDNYGTYLLNNDGKASRYETYSEICINAGYDKELIVPANAATIKYARRQKNTMMQSLTFETTFHHRLESWKDACKRMIDDMKKEKLL